MKALTRTMLSILFQKMLEIEQTILLSDTAIPVYVMHWSPEVQNLMNNLADSKIIDENASSAAKGIQIILVLIFTIRFW